MGKYKILEKEDIAPVGRIKGRQARIRQIVGRIFERSAKGFFKNRASICRIRASRPLIRPTIKEVLIT